MRTAYVVRYRGPYVALGVCLALALAACQSSNDGLNAVMTTKLPVSGEIVFTQ